MSADLRDKIASALYLFTEQADQGTPGWDELIANHGEDYEAIVAYRNMADFVMPAIRLDQHILVALQIGWDVGREFGDPYQRRGPHSPADNPFRAAAVTGVEPGCTCNGIAACEQCQERDTQIARGDA